LESPSLRCQSQSFSTVNDHGLSNILNLLVFRYDNDCPEASAALVADGRDAAVEDREVRRAPVREGAQAERAQPAPPGRAVRGVCLPDEPAGADRVDRGRPEQARRPAE